MTDPAATAAATDAPRSDPPAEHERTRCEVWTRVMGYHRPVSAFNPGKESEHRDRVPFREAPGWEQYDRSRGVAPLTYADLPTEDDGETD